MSLLLAVALLTSAPADAPATPSPTVAAALSGLAAPAALAGAVTGYVLTEGILDGGLGNISGASAGFWGPVVLATPLLYGSGQLYAGEPERALGFGALGPVAVFGGAFAGGLVAHLVLAAQPTVDWTTHRDDALGAFFVGAATLIVAEGIYGVVSGLDAYHAAALKAQP